jgi:Tfp pilus assembly protein PilE
VNERTQRADRGSTLVELLAAIALVGVVIVPIMSASWSLVHNSGFSRNLSKVDTVVNNAADRVNRAPTACDYTIYVEAAALSQGWAATTISATYRYYEPAASATTAGAWQSGACPNGVRPAGLVQLVDITATSPDQSVTRHLQVVKSDV